MSKDDIKQLYLCSIAYMNYPKKFQSKIVVNSLIKKLTEINCNLVYPILGKYYLEYEKV